MGIYIGLQLYILTGLAVDLLFLIKSYFKIITVTDNTGKRILITTSKAFRCLLVYTFFWPVVWAFILVRAAHKPTKK